MVWFVLRHIAIQLNNVTIFYFGIFVNLLVAYRVKMPKSIFSRQQEQLQKLLRQTRLDAKITQVALAKRLNQTQSFVSKYESGERRLDAVELQLVCQALGVSLSEFIRRWEDSL